MVNEKEFIDIKMENIREQKNFWHDSVELASICFSCFDDKFKVHICVELELVCIEDIKFIKSIQNFTHLTNRVVVPFDCDVESKLQLPSF